MHPLLYETFARVWLAESGARSLADVPDGVLDRLAAAGFDHLWLMGVWTIGTIGAQIAREHEGVRQDLDVMLPGWTAGDVVGSPYAIARYAVDPALGGDAALATLRTRLAARGIRLILDFVPNHTARDHHWVDDAPELYVHEADGTIACGKDPYFPAWTDTAQLDHRVSCTRERLITTLLEIAERADGVRCDMSMLVLPDIFARTWVHLPPAPHQPLATGEFWAAAIHAVRARHPAFTFLAEAYWELEGRLQRLGFDFTYDKALYDRLLHGDAAAIRAHLGADLEYQVRSVRFVENHDEPRIAHELSPARRAAALVIAMTVPGMRFIHDGQIEGRRIRTSVHLGKRVAEAPAPGAIALHASLFELLRSPALREGAFRLLAATGSLVAHRWEHRHGSVIVVVNYGADEVTAQFPVELHGIDGRSVLLHDRLTGTDYARDGTELVDPARGLFVRLAPWQIHIFDVR
jgi:hypothetical protein